MPHKYLLSIALAASLIGGAANAQDARTKKAEAVVEAMLEIDGREQVRLAVEDMLRQTGEYEFRSEYMKFFEGVLRSPEFRAAKARAFAQAFTEPELDDLLVLARDPVFRRYQERTPALQVASRAALTESMRSKFVEFAHRIEALKESQRKR